MNILLANYHNVNTIPATLTFQLTGSMYDNVTGKRQWHILQSWKSANLLYIHWQSEFKSDDNITLGYTESQSSPNLKNKCQLECVGGAQVRAGMNGKPLNPSTGDKCHPALVGGIKLGLQRASVYTNIFGNLLTVSWGRAQPPQYELLQVSPLGAGRII